MTRHSSVIISLVKGLKIFFPFLHTRKSKKFSIKGGTLKVNNALQVSGSQLETCISYSFK